MDDIKMQECIKACSECYETCFKTIQHCLDKGGEHASREHITLLQDCAEVCQLAVSFMLRNSEYAAKLCGLCAEICKRCAEQCEQMAGDDQTMKDCAEMCRNCAQACDQMSGMS